MTKIIAITNQKGGVGKTTTSVNLSSCLAYENKKTLLIDCDPQGNSTSGLGIEKDDYELSIYDCFVDSSKTKDAVIKTKYNNLYVIPSSSDLSAAEIELAYEDKREFFLKNAIDMIKENFDYIIIDSPPALGMITINIMTASDSVLIPIQCEYYALEGLSQLITTIKTIKKKLNPQIEIEGVLGTMYDGRTNLSIQVLDEVKKYFPDKVYKTIIPRNVRLSESPSFGEPIINYDRTSKVQTHIWLWQRKLYETINNLINVSKGVSIWLKKVWAKGLILFLMKKILKKLLPKLLNLQRGT